MPHIIISLQLCHQADSGHGDIILPPGGPCSTDHALPTTTAPITGRLLNTSGGLAMNHHHGDAPNWRGFNVVRHGAQHLRGFRFPNALGPSATGPTRIGCVRGSAALSRPHTERAVHRTHAIITHERGARRALRPLPVPIISEDGHVRGALHVERLQRQRDQQSAATCPLTSADAETALIAVSASADVVEVPGTIREDVKM
ncbi:hypothetical protein ISCGN_002087 [Ixodes scapularis]